MRLYRSKYTLPTGTARFPGCPVVCTGEYLQPGFHTCHLQFRYKRLRLEDEGLEQ